MLISTAMKAKAVSPVSTLVVYGFSLRKAVAGNRGSELHISNPRFAVFPGNRQIGGPDSVPVLATSYTAYQTLVS